jgi:hypothetical protein
MNPQHFRNFDVDKNGIISFKKPHQWYWFDQSELSHYYETGEHRWFPHLAQKNWFTENMFWELLDYAKKIHPTVNFDKAVFQASFHFAERGFYDNFEFHRMLHDGAHKSTVWKDDEGRTFLGDKQIG